MNREPLHMEIVNGKLNEAREERDMIQVIFKRLDDLTVMVRNNSDQIDGIKKTLDSILAILSVIYIGVRTLIGKRFIFNFY